MFHQIIGQKNVVNYWMLVVQWWTNMNQEALDFHQFLKFSLPCNFLKFDILKNYL
jgi:hypothetical protein